MIAERVQRPIAIAGLHEIADRFDGVLLDQWGALHDGRQVFPAARHCVERLHAAGKRILILSNSGKRADDNIRRLAALGLPSAAYDALLTSGETARLGLRDRTEPPFDRLGRGCLLIARGGDRSVVEGVGIKVTADISNAPDFIFLAGLDDDRAAPEAWRSLLTEASRRRLPMLCANPDLTMFGAAGLLPGPGALGRFYESLGGTVHYVGKPHAPIFAAALRALGGVPAGRVLVVGDSLDHDVLGGNRAGMLTALIASGVHAAELDDRGGDMAAAVVKLAGDDGRMPRWVLHELRW